MFNKTIELSGIEVSVVGFADKEDGTPWAEPVDLTFKLSPTTAAKVLVNLTVDDAKLLARTLGSAIQHIENDRSEKQSELDALKDELSEAVEHGLNLEGQLADVTAELRRDIEASEGGDL